MPTKILLAEDHHIMRQGLRSLLEEQNMVEVVGEAKNGRETVLLPVKELGLPETYHQPWHGRPHRILVYPTSKGPVWGITAEIVSEIIKLLS